MLGELLYVLTLLRVPGAIRGIADNEMFVVETVVADKVDCGLAAQSNMAVCVPRFSD